MLIDSFAISYIKHEKQWRLHLGTHLKLPNQFLALLDTFPSRASISVLMSCDEYIWYKNSHRQCHGSKGSQALSIHSSRLPIQ